MFFEIEQNIQEKINIKITLYNMKSLKDFLFESSQEEKNFVFSFKDLENGEETLKSLADVYGCTVDEEKKQVSITVTPDNASKLETAQDILQQYAQKLRSSTKRASDEQYAQKTRAFADKVADLNDAIDEMLAGDEDKDKTKEEE